MLPEDPAQADTNDRHALTDLVLEIVLAAGRLSRRVGNRLAAHGISLSEYLIMRYLAANGERGVPRIELAEHVAMSASGVTRMLAPMEKLHLITTDTDSRDARHRLVRLTPAGRQVCEDAGVTLRDSAEMFLGHLDPEAAEGAVAVLRAIQ